MGQPNEFAQPLPVTCRVDEGFQEWLVRSGGAVALTTYQAGKVALIGWDGQQITLLLRHFDKPLGLALEEDYLALATREDVVVFGNARALAGDYLPHQPGHYDALYLPRATFHTGDISAHDVTIVDGEVILVNTRFSCLARVGWRYSFEPLWRPPFISDITPEDRCHLNGLAVVEKKLAYVTAHAASDTREGWRNHRLDGGVVVAVEENEVVLTGLCMPHSPRWYAGRLWFLNSGKGELVGWSPGDKPEVVCRLPGYTRGLSFAGAYALVGLSKIREKYHFGGVPVEQYFPQLMCGVALVDLRSGNWEGTFEFTSGCTELYDVQFLPGSRRPMIVNLEKSAAREAFTLPECAFWIRKVPTDPALGSVVTTDSKVSQLGESQSAGLGLKHF